MARPIKNKRSGVTVKIRHDTAKKVIEVIDKTHRSFSSEVNMAVEEYADAKIVKFRDDGR